MKVLFSSKAVIHVDDFFLKFVNKVHQLERIFQELSFECDKWSQSDFTTWLSLHPNSIFKENSDKILKMGEIVLDLF